jgi:hypothetical protein
MQSPMIMQDGEAEMHVDRSELPAGRKHHRPHYVRTCRVMTPATAGLTSMVSHERARGLKGPCPIFSPFYYHTPDRWADQWSLG